MYTLRKHVILGMSLFGVLFMVLSVVFSQPASAATFESARVSIPDDVADQMEGWETPFEPSSDLLEQFRDSEDSGTCWNALNVKIDLIAEETRYWRAIAEPGSDGAETLQTVLNNLQKLQRGMSENRLSLEKAGGDSDSCESNDDFAYISDPIEDNKIYMRIAGIRINENGDERELTEETVANRCERADSAIESLGNKVQNLENKLENAAENGNLDEASNTTELLNMSEINLGEAASLLKQGNERSSQALEAKMRDCTGAYDQAAIGQSLVKRGQRFRKGKNEDSSSEVQHIDAKIKMFLRVIAEKRAEALRVDNKADVLEVLDTARQRVIEVQEAFGLVKYDSSPDVDGFDEDIEAIKEDLRAVADTIDEGEEVERTTGKDRRAVKSLMTKARRQIRSLNRMVNNKEDAADTTDEEQLVQYIELSVLDDARTSRAAGIALKRDQDYVEAQQRAFRVIEMSKAAKEVLGTID